MTILPSRQGKEPQARRAWIKRATVALPLLCLLIFGTFIGMRLAGNALGANADSLTQLPGYVPALVSKSSLVGQIDTNQSFSVSVSLRLRNIGSLKSFVDSTHHQKSVTAHQHLTTTAVTEAYAPLASSQQSVIDYMRNYGFQVTATTTQHLVVGFKGTANDVENAFHVQINNYRSSTGKNFYAPANNPSVPESLAGVIQSIVGLDNVTTFKHQPLRPVHHALTVATTSSAGNCPAAAYPTMQNPGGYIPSQIATAYNLNSFYNAGFNGENQTVALFELDDYSQADINAYTSCFGGSGVAIHRIPVDGGVPLDQNQGAIEVELDMDMVLSAAPHLANLDVYESAGTDADYIDEWAQVVNDRVPVVSTSWGACEADFTPLVQAENSLFMIAAAQGQSIFAAAGDDGTNDCRTPLNSTNPPPSIAVDDPASQPYVIGVGGTSLTVNSSDNTYSSEKVWNNGLQPDDTVWAGGGGISTEWPMPSWQQISGVINTNSSGAPCKQPSGSYCREVPDVSLSADPSIGYEEYCTQSSCPSTSQDNNGWFAIGGTSAAAPMWAAFIALANEKTMHDQGFNIGFVAPYLYQIYQNAGGTSYSNDFHDITVGTNDGLNDSKNIYPATAGYDMASGLGSYNAWNLADDLEKLAKNTSAPTSTTWYFAEGKVGGGFREYITVLNPSSQTADVTVQYLFQNQPVVKKTYTFVADSRSTINVNADLNIPQNGSPQSISAIVTSTNGVGIVVERPMYFTFHGIASGTDVLGATNITNTTFYFAAGDNRQDSSNSANEYITVLNPNQTATTVDAYYYNGGKVVEHDQIVVGPMQRGTTSPTFIGQTAVKVVASQGVVVERPNYIHENIPTAGGWTNGASSTVGATTPGTDWLFAEGYTGANYQENLVLANFDSQNTAQATVNLEYTNGTVQSVTVPVAPQSQYIFNVNSHKGASNSVSIEVKSDNPIVAERVQYFHYSLGGHSAPGMNDVVGQAGPAKQNIYTFAEGSTGTNFNDWLTLQNPNNTPASVVIVLFVSDVEIPVGMTLPAHSRSSVRLNDIVDPIVKANPSLGYSVSAEVQSFGGPIVVERPLYFIFAGTTGGTDVLGYTGN